MNKRIRNNYFKDRINNTKEEEEEVKQSFTNYDINIDDITKMYQDIQSNNKVYYNDNYLKNLQDNFIFDNSPKPDKLFTFVMAVKK